MTSPLQSAGLHLLFSSIPAWGHAKPFCILAARLVQENRNIIVTLLLAPNLLSKAKAEVSAELHDSVDEGIRRRLRISSTFKSSSPDLFSLLDPLIQTYGQAYQDLWQAKPISCAMTGTVFDAAPPPNAVILDFFAYQQMLATRAISGTSVPVVAWATGHAAHLVRHFGPARLGGSDEDFSSRVEAEVVRTGLTAQEIGDSVYTRTKGKVIRVPGAPALYDWEFFPQTLPFSAPQWIEIIMAADAGLKECDAVFATSAYTFEEESLGAFKSWFADWKKEVYVIGPLLTIKKAEDIPENAKAKDFLVKAQAKYGEKSVLLISFGTIFWPTVQNYIDEVVEALIEKEFPFIIAYASPFAKISDDLIEKVNATGLGLISKWIPQQYILSHPATGWFMTHGGHNSVMETLGSGIPMICWPFEADQPIATARMSEDLKVAFELIEVRTGDNGMKPLLRNGRKAQGTRDAVGIEIREVIDACRGSAGDELRKNAQAINAKFAKTWEAEGVSRNEFHAFLRKYGLEVLYSPLRNQGPAEQGPWQSA